MSDQSVAAQGSVVPLCVDLDGTLIKNDLLQESLLRLLRRNPSMLFVLPFWGVRGLAHLKRQIARRVELDAAALPYHKPFLEFLRAAKREGRPLILATASDVALASQVADHVGLFAEVLASDGKTNLRGRVKLERLTRRFGHRGFDYAGNSFVDLAVWREARAAVVVNAGDRLLKRVRQVTEVSAVFPRESSRRFCRNRWLLALLAGLLLAASFPKIGVASLAWIAPALMVVAAFGKSGSEAFRIGYIAGLVQWLASLYWLLLVPVAWYPILGWLALCAYLALYPATWVWLLISVQSSKSKVQSPDFFSFATIGIGSCGWCKRALWAAVGAGTWVALEMIRARMLGGFPWNPLGASQYELLPLIQIASVTGIGGVSFIVVWCSLSLFLAATAILRRPTTRGVWIGEIILPLAVLVALFSFGSVRLSQQPATATRELNVAFVQPSIPQTMIWSENEDAVRFKRVVTLSEQALTQHVNLLLWPEAAVPEKIRYDQGTLDTVAGLARSHRVWMIVGSDDMEPASHPRTPDDVDYFNASFLISPDGQLVARYCKRHLVIFGEYIPFVRQLPFLTWFVPGSQATVGFTPGTQAVPFELRGLSVKTSVLICFEDIFPNLARDSADDGTDFLLNLTNNGWFGESAAQWQHAAAAIFRAIENGLPLLRCSNNGLTCWVDANGRIRKIFHDNAGSVYGTGVMTAHIPLLEPGCSRAPTFYHRHGDWFGWGCVGVAAVTLAAALRKSLTAKQHQ